MARPSRPPAEREAVRAAAAGRSGSVRAIAAQLARDVTAAAMEGYDLPPDDVVAMLARLAADMDPSPISRLAYDPEIDTASLIRKARIARFEARACRHLREWEWRSENAAIAREVRRTLAERYGRHLRQQIRT